MSRKMSSSSSSSNGAMEMVSIVWHNPLITGAVILLLTPPFYPLLVYFSPLLMSTALCVAALLSIGPQIEKLQAQREEGGGGGPAAADGGVVPANRRSEQDVPANRRSEQGVPAGAWIRVPDIVAADSVTSAAAPRLAAQRYEHLGEWSGESEVRRVWSSRRRSAAQETTRTREEEGAELQRGTKIPSSNNKAAKKEEEEDRWAAWVREYEARPEWNEATAPPSQDGGFAAAVKREQEMQREKECLKRQKDQLKERFKLAAMEAKLQRQQTAQAAAPAAGEEAPAAPAQQTMKPLVGQPCAAAASNKVVEDSSSTPPPKTHVPAQVLHQLKTAGLGGLGRLKVRCSSPGTNAAAHGNVAASAGAPETSSRSSTINQTSLTGREQQVMRTAAVTMDLSSQVISSTPPSSRGKQLSPGMLHILKTAGLGGCNNGKESLELAAATMVASPSDRAGKKSSVAAGGGQRCVVGSRESSSDEQESDDDESEDDDDDDDDDANEYPELWKHLMENRSQTTSQLKPAVVPNLLQRPVSYKGSNICETGKKLQQRTHQQQGMMTQEDTPDTTSTKLVGSSSFSSSQATFQQHYSTFKKTDCNTSENLSSSSSCTTTHQAKDKGSTTVALGRSHSTCRQSSQLDPPTPMNSECQSLHKSLSRSLSLRAPASNISRLDDSSRSHRRRNSTMATTLKPLVWKSRSSDSMEEEDAI
ncbi:unnamed protein product [Sphagnum troendelagicum]|uniref:Uncharacterized protein n=1 Tax=Sphagnum troendelagicum TaxID=128251 RepID=A0ABP0UJF3_9BRYO